VAIYVVGTSLYEGPNTSMDFYRAVATVTPTLLITVAIRGRIFELSRKVTPAPVPDGALRGGFVVFAGEAARS
jgi:hypothetical protein